MLRKGIPSTLFLLRASLLTAKYPRPLLLAAPDVDARDIEVYSESRRWL